ncbi:MAG TPA: CARDB domain-containing protein, partial [Geobacteraceae bacterium]
MTTDYYATVSVLDSLSASGDTSPAYINGLAWLNNASFETTTYLAPRVKAVAVSGGDVTTDVNTLLSYRNSDSGWGGYLNQASSNFHTAFALQALKAANFTDQTIIFGAISYLLSAQNTDGGWGFTQGDTSNVFDTAQVLSTLAQYKTTYLTDQQIAQGATLLYSAQNPDGGFGTGQSTVYETALALIALIESGQGQTQPLLNAVNYLTVSQLADGSWNDDPYATALALRALAHVKPDLAVAAADISITPASPSAGQSVTVTATIHNSGLDTAANVTVRLLDNGTLVGDQFIGAINPGGAGQATFALNTIAPAGEHILTVAIDPANTINELSRANNSATLRTWAAAPADLVIEPEYL